MCCTVTLYSEDPLELLDASSMGVQSRSECETRAAFSEDDQEPVCTVTWADSPPAPGRYHKISLSAIFCSKKYHLLVSHHRNMTLPEIWKKSNLCCHM